MFNIVIAGLKHETNAFSNQLADLEFFKSREYLVGDEIIPFYTDTGTDFGGMLKVLDGREDVNLLPVVSADAMPSGPVTDEMAENVANMVVDAIRSAPKVDGVLLCLHGAMVTQSSEDGEGDFLEAVRGAVGKNVPIFAVLDLHSNVTDKMIEYADAIFHYHYYPHVDMYERGIEAAEAMLDTLCGQIRPTMAYSKKPLLLASITTEDPVMKSLVDMCREYENDPRVMSVSISHGFFWADIYELGAAVVAVTDKEPELAQAIADELADKVWDQRAALIRTLFTADEAIDKAMAAKHGPVVLSDGADNPGGGSSCDGTHLLRAMIERDVQNAALAMIYDPESVSMAEKAGVGNIVNLRLGGKIRPDILGEPIEGPAYVKSLSDGKYVNKGPMGRGLPVDLKKSAVVVIGGIEVIVSSNVTQPYDAQIFRAHGIEPKDRKIIVVKSTVHFRAHFQPMATKVLDVDCPGLLPQDPASIEYKNCRRPIYPLDDI